MIEHLQSIKKKNRLNRQKLWTATDSTKEMTKKSKLNHNKILFNFWENFESLTVTSSGKSVEKREFS